MTYQPKTCGACNGAKGRTIIISDGKTTRQHWVNCGACGGKGVR
jgi:DnaJ-class molecular chaperone